MRIKDVERLTTDTKCTALRISAPELDEEIWKIIRDIAQGTQRLEDYMKPQPEVETESALAGLLSQKTDWKREKNKFENGIKKEP